MAMRKFWIASLLGTLAVAGCNQSPVSYGAQNSIIVIAADPLWESVQDTVAMVLEPPIFTVREERTFDLTHASPANPVWQQFRMWRQVLVIGDADDSWVQPALEKADSVPTELPAFFQVRDVWARNQEVTVVLLPSSSDRAALLELLPELHAYVDGRFRAYVRERMFTSGPNDELREALESSAGFSLTVPNVYRVAELDSVYVFRNDQQRQSELIRSIVVSWREALPVEEITPELVLAWRDSLSLDFHDPMQMVDHDRGVQAREIDGGVEIRGVWKTLPDDWPGAGPYVERVVVCPEQDRTYLLDAWLYAPGQGKYEYMLQLETILDTFACTAS
ncbi:MAG TPA: DUF4837 family protein [Longimicrobiales bacterium]|nr:DUF4837 family protein [Longimicrobiales bacterium]